MNKKIKKKWLEALRSGQYQQTRFKLRDIDNNFCCLGVLCDIYSNETKNRWHKIYFEDELIAYSLHNSNHHLPLEVVIWSELDKSSGGDVYIKELKTYLTSLNDNKISFIEIANIIEKYL